MTDQRRLLTSGQLATELGVSVDTIRRWRRTERIQPDTVTAYGHPRWDLEAVRRQLAEFPTAPAAGEPDDDPWAET